MADPAKAEKIPWGERRKKALAACRLEPCYPVETIFLRGDVTVAYPPCILCAHEGRLKKLKGY